MNMHAVRKFNVSMGVVRRVLRNVDVGILWGPLSVHASYEDGDSEAGMLAVENKVS
jgi:hypothetical protein